MDSGYFLTGVSHIPDTTVLKKNKHPQVGQMLAFSELLMPAGFPWNSKSGADRKCLVSGEKRLLTGLSVHAGMPGSISAA